MSMVRRSPYWKPGYENGRATRHSESEFLCQHLKEKNWPGIHNWHFKWKRSQLLLYLNIITFLTFLFYIGILISWRRGWQPTPVFLPGEFHEQRSLVGCSPKGCRVGHDRSDWTCTPCWLTMLWQFQADSKGTQLYVYMYPFSPKLPSHPGCCITLSRVPCATQ